MFLNRFGAVRRCFSTSGTTTVTVEAYKAVTVIGLNRPEKQNAFNTEMVKGLSSALKAFDNDPNSRVALIHGIGGNFSAGYDAEDVENELKNTENGLNGFKLAAGKFSSKPIICCISGLCKSIALEIALKCDIRILENNAVMGFYGNRCEIPLINGGPKKLSDLVGASTALDLAITRREISAAQAKDIGITSCITTEGGCVGRGLSMAVQISTMPPLALKYNVEAIREEALAIDRALLEETRKEIERLKDELTLAFSSAKKPTRHFNYEILADWEKDEYQRELDYQRKINDKN